MVQPLRDYCLFIKERDTAQLLKYIYPDLRPKSLNQFNPTDYVSDKIGIDFELKNRNEGYGAYLIEKDKYDVLMECNIGYYICTGGNGIYCFDVKKYTNENKLYWRTELHNKTTEFEDNRKVPKEVDYWNISEAENLNILLSYPYHQTNHKSDKRFTFDFMKY